MKKYIHTYAQYNEISGNEIIPFIMQIVKPGSVVDFGCGNGSWLKVFETYGVNDLLGIDIVKLNDNDLLIKKDNIINQDLSNKINLDRQFDLVICLEVAEHLSEKHSENLIDNLCTHGDIILFSAAIPGQGGQYHKNEQWHTYWEAKFNQRGYLSYDILREKFWDNEKILWWYRQNLILYANRTSNIVGMHKISEKKVKNIIHPDLYNKKVLNPKFMDNKIQIIKLLKSCIKYIIKI